MSVTAVKHDLYEKKFAIIEEISSAIVVTDNLEAVANLMLDMAVGYTNAEKGSLLLAEDEHLTILAARGIDPAHRRDYRVKIGEGIAGTVAANLEPVLVTDITTDPRFKGKRRERYRTRSFISCPIISHSKLLGVFNVNDKKDRTNFTEDEFALLRIIANQAAITLENAILMGKLKNKVAEHEEMNRKLVEMDLVKTEFLTRVSHELRTPLNAIKGAIYYLQQTGLPTNDGHQEFHGIISSETGKLISIVENQLDFLRLEDETKLVTKTIVSVDEVLAEAANSKSLRAALRRANISVVAEPATVAAVVADRVRMVQMLCNLIEGLAAFAVEGDTITISAHEKNMVEIVIRLPHQVPQNLLPFLFQFNHLLKTDTSIEKMKLYLAQRVSDLHGWHVDVANDADGFSLAIAIPPCEQQKVEAAINTTMELFLEFISELLEVDTSSVMLREPNNDDLTIKTARGLDPDVIRRTRITPGESIAGWVALEGKPLYVANIETDQRFTGRSTATYKSKSLISLPIEVGNRVIGVLNLTDKRNHTSFDQHDFGVAKLLGNRISRFLQDLEQGVKESDLKRLRNEFDMLLGAQRNYPKKGNLQPRLTWDIMKKMEAGEEETSVAVYASMVYDLGLTLIDERVMKKKQLQEMDKGSLRVHPYGTVGLLNCFEFSPDIKQIILHHHEKFDGSGYPEGLNGNDIPLASRVLAVVDAYSAMLEERPYRSAMAEEDVLREIRDGAGTKFDPAVVRALEETLGR